MVGESHAGGCGTHQDNTSAVCQKTNGGSGHRECCGQISKDGLFVFGLRSHGDWLEKDGPRQTSHRIQPSHALACRFKDSGCGFKITRLEDVTLAAQRGGGGLEPFGISPRDGDLSPAGHELRCGRVADATGSTNENDSGALHG